VVPVTALTPARREDHGGLIHSILSDIADRGEYWDAENGGDLVTPADLKLTLDYLLTAADEADRLRAERDRWSRIATNAKVSFSLWMCEECDNLAFSGHVCCHCGNES